jgi:prepilin-type N-terminal cleavage/methylation domain-containing protein
VSGRGAGTGQAAGRARERGFTLVEFMVAIGIAGVIVSSIGSLFFRAGFESRLAREDSLASIAAENRLEEMLRAPITSSDWTAGVHEVATQALVLHWFVSVDSPGPGARTVSVTAWRPGAKRKARHVAVRAR